MLDEPGNRNAREVYLRFAQGPPRTAKRFAAASPAQVNNHTGALIRNGVRSTQLRIKAPSTPSTPPRWRERGSAAP